MREPASSKPEGQLGRRPDARLRRYGYGQKQARPVQEQQVFLNNHGAGAIH